MRVKMLCFVIGFVLIAVTAFAGSSAEVVSIDLDNKGNIRIWTQYKVDGVEVESQYPKIDGKSVYCSRYYSLNFVGMDDAEKDARILEDVNVHTEKLIRKEYIKKSNIDILDNHLKGVVGSKVTKTTASIEVDLDGDGINDETWLLKTDGTHTTAVITP